MPAPVQEPASLFDDEEDEEFDQPLSKREQKKAERLRRKEAKKAAYDDMAVGQTASACYYYQVTGPQPTKAMWNDNSRKLLDAGHAKGKVITRPNATAGAGIPFHPGAEKFYKEAGLLK